MDKYEEALQKAKRLYDGLDGYSSNRKVLEEIFPELAGSEDERIIEGFKNLLKRIKDSGGLTLNMVPVERCEAWLEKQKEQKPAEWSEEDERKRLACIDTINEVIDYERDRWEDYNPGKPYRPITKYDEQIDWLKSLRPSWKPSETQMSMLLAVINEPNNAGSESCHLALKSIYEQLKKQNT